MRLLVPVLDLATVMHGPMMVVVVRKASRPGRRTG
jgi:hypothetical protein